MGPAAREDKQTCLHLEGVIQKAVLTEAQFGYTDARSDMGQFTYALGGQANEC
jgi:hypothetical protein